MKQPSSYISKLRQSLVELFGGHHFAEIDTEFEKYRIEKGIGFFPYGNGFISESVNDIPIGGILILGKDFGTKDYFERVREEGEGEKPTMSNLKKILSPEFEKSVFCINVFMGLRDVKGESQKASNLSEFPQRFNVEYLTLCKELFRLTISLVKPVKILTLGQFPKEFVEMNFPEERKKIVPIAHPSMWHFNWKISDSEKQEKIHSSLKS